LARFAVLVGLVDESELGLDSGLPVPFLNEFVFGEALNKITVRAGRMPTLYFHEFLVVLSRVRTYRPTKLLVHT
jgi:hypothetical protein